MLNRKIKKGMENHHDKLAILNLGAKYYVSYDEGWGIVTASCDNWDMLSSNIPDSKYSDWQIVNKKEFYNE